MYVRKHAITYAPTHLCTYACLCTPMYVRMYGRREDPYDWKEDAELAFMVGRLALQGEPLV